MKYIFLLLLAIITFSPTPADAVWFDSNWNYKVKVEVVPSKVGTTTAVTNFPVYLDLAGMPASFWTNASNTGADIRMVESDDTTETAFELVSYATSTKQGELHFLADSLATTSTSTFYLYYGNTVAQAYASTSAFGSRNVWRSEYKLVHHMQSATTTTFDSTSNTLNGTVTNMDNTNLVQGKLSGRGFNFNGTDEYVTRGVDDALLDFDTGSFVISFWADADEWNSLDGIFSKKLADINGGYELYQNDGFRLVDNTNALEDYNATNLVSTTTSWSLYQFYGSPATGVDIYRNGAALTLSFDDGPYSVSIKNTTHAFRYGSAEARSFFDGQLDEIRIASGTLLSPAWFVTEYNNQSSTSTFFVIGAEQTNATGTAATSTDTGIIWFE